MKVFKAFHPYLSYSGKRKLFIAPDGQQSFAGWGASFENVEDNEDLFELWELGKEAFVALGDLKNKEDFKKLSKYYLESIRTLRLAIGQCIQEDAAKKNLINGHDEHVSVDVDDFSDDTVVSVAWEMYQWLPQQKEFSERLRLCLLFTCLKNIDNAIIAMSVDGEGAVSSAIEAARSFANFEAFGWGSESLRSMRSKLAANSAMARYKKDPKQKEKIFVRECWAIWQTRPESYDGKASFARAMLDKCEHLQSQKKIEDWCRAWEAETVSLPAK